jgi:Na+/melibiose symporter-like transporter
MKEQNRASAQSKIALLLTGSAVAGVFWLGLVLRWLLFEQQLSAQGAAAIVLRLLILVLPAGIMLALVSAVRTWAATRRGRP